MDRPLPAIMPEDSPPEAGFSCERCELARHGGRVVWGEGNPDAPLFVLLDNPGAREDKEGASYLCGTRETLQAAAFEAGLEPDSMYVSYILKCRPRRAYDKVRARTICLSYLWEQLKAVNPVLVVCLGNVVCQTFFDDPQAEVKQLRGMIHAVRGHNVVASYHPLAVRRRPVLYKYFLQDWVLAADRLNRPG